MGQSKTKTDIDDGFLSAQVAYKVVHKVASKSHCPITKITTQVFRIPHTLAAAFETHLARSTGFALVSVWGEKILQNAQSQWYSWCGCETCLPISYGQWPLQRSTKG
jgi:hypothetical protein